MNIGALRGTAKRFMGTLEERREKVGPTDFTWYGYDILANVWHLNNLLTGKNRKLLKAVRGEVIADVGAADGDLAFLLEHIGFDVDIIDHAPTNWNGLRGARALKDALNSDVTIHDISLDEYFQLPRERYGLTFALGVLYHLKNPFYVLETFAECSEYICVSTRIANFTVDETSIGTSPVAYLLDADECNGDATNYWIFSPLGLKRIFDRAGWHILDYMEVGEVARANPAAPDRDARAFVLARSRRLAL